jgi:hypothetical protein
LGRCHRLRTAEPHMSWSGFG